MSRAFLDSNVLVYAFSDDEKAERALVLLSTATMVGVQTLNEFANVSRRKAKRDWAEVEADLLRLRQLFPNPIPIDVDLHREGIRIARRYQLQLWDGMIVAAALQSGCDVLWSEDMHNGLVIDRRLQVRNPFRTN